MQSKLETATKIEKLVFKVKVVLTLKQAHLKRHNFFFKANTRCFLFASVADNFYVSSLKTTSDLSNLPKTKVIKKKKDFGAAP